MLSWAGILNRNELLNYLIILGKLCIWECRRNKSITSTQSGSQEREWKAYCLKKQEALRSYEKVGTVTIIILVLILRGGNTG